MFVIGSFEKFFGGYMRREFTQNLEDGYGEYIPCIIHGLRVVRGRSLEFQAVLADDEHAGVGFLAPIHAFCWRIPDEPRAKGEVVDMTYIQPWDCFSDTFGVHEFEFHRRMRCLVLPDRREARYRFSLDFVGSSLAEWNEQHKHLHIVEMQDGSIGAFPNNRLLWLEPAIWKHPPETLPKLTALDGEWMAE